jgi:Zn-dependent peptidase ImmA (M78 family)
MAAARAARARLGLGTTEPVGDLLALVEERGRIPVAVLRMAETTAGAYVVARGRPVILLNGLQWPTRARFTLAHEIGHHRMGHGPVVDDVAAVTGRSHDPREVEANQFAAEFLMPEAGVRAWWARHGGDGPVTTEHAVRLAVAYGVSAPAARFRLQEAGCLTDRALAARIDDEIRDREHRWIVNAFGLQEPRDSLTEAATRLPRIPPALRGSVLAQRLGAR